MESGISFKESINISKEIYEAAHEKIVFSKIKKTAKPKPNFKLEKSDSKRYLSVVFSQKKSKNCTIFWSMRRMTTGVGAFERPNQRGPSTTFFFRSVGAEGVFSAPSRSKEENIQY